MVKAKTAIDPSGWKRIGEFTCESKRYQPAARATLPANKGASIRLSEGPVHFQKVAMQASAV